MKKIWILFLFVMLIQFATAQINLVPNWSFEDTVACPTGISQIDKASGWSSYKLTPDYLNSCNNNQVGIPFNTFGYQNSRTGNAYAGFYSFGKYSTNYREIIGIQLSQQLSIGNSYYVTFFLSRAYNPDPGFHLNIATNKLGVRFSTVPYSDINAIQIDNFAHIYTDSVIYDTLNWVQISGFFVADSTYQYLSIGNFFTDSITSSILLDTSAALAYYYVEDILVIDSSLTSMNESGSSNLIEIYPNVFHDELIIEGNDVKSIQIFDASGRKRIEHSTASSLHKINVSILSRGMYFIRVNTLGNSFVKKVIKQ